MQGISPKQNEVYELARSRKVQKLKIFLIGAIGTSKTYIMALIFINIARQYPGSFIPMGRKTLADARVSTLHVFVEALNDMGLEDGKHYRSIGLYGGNTIMFVFENKSIIQFVPMDETKDRDWAKVRGIPATCVGFDEVDSIKHDGFTALSSRAGRKNRDGQPDITIATCNPNETWVKEYIYTPWRKGRLPEDTVVVEFKMEDSFLFKEGYYKGYRTNPIQWQQRYLYNNWDYLDDEDSLFKTRVLDAIHTPNFNSEGDRYLGVDTAREGRDRNVFAEIIGNTLTNLKIYNRDDLKRLAKPEEKEAPPYSHIIGREVVRYQDKRYIGWQNTGVDALPSGVVDYLRSVKRPVYEYKPGSRSLPRKATAEEERKGIKPKPDYDMIRSEGAYMLSQDMEQGKFFLWDGCPHLSDLKQELLWHGFETKDQMFCVEKKIEIKKRLGKSPDLADSVFIAYWMSKQKRSIGTYGNKKPEPVDAKPTTAGMLDMKF